MRVVKIKVSAFDSLILDKCVGEIVSVAIKNGGNVQGPIPMPTKHKRHVVNRSPHIDKKSREVLFLHIHTRLLMIEADESTDVLKHLQSIQIQPGIGIKVETIKSSVKAA